MAQHNTAAATTTKLNCNNNQSQSLSAKFFVFVLHLCLSVCMCVCVPGNKFISIVYACERDAATTRERVYVCVWSLRGATNMALPLARWNKFHVTAATSASGAGTYTNLFACVCMCVCVYLHNRVHFLCFAALLLLLLFFFSLCLFSLWVAKQTKVASKCQRNANKTFRQLLCSGLA